MKSNQENSFEFFDRIRKSLSSGFVKFSGKLPLSRLDKIFSQRLRIQNLKNLSNSELASKFTSFIKSHVKSPKFSLSQLKLTGDVFKTIGPKKIGAALLAVALTFVIIGANLRVEAVAIKVDGKTVAITTDKDATEKILDELKAEKARVWKRKVDVKQRLVFENVKAKRYEIDDLSSVKNKLNKNITFVAIATGIKVNGKVAVVVKDAATAEALLEELKKSYTAKKLQVEEVSFAEKVELADVPASLKDVMDPDEALRTLKEGKQKKVVHIVEKGDSLWLIARRNNMTVEDLLKANPSIEGDRLDLGDEINLVALEPMINVIVTGKQTVEEKVPFKVVVQKDSSMWRGRQKIKTPGENGSKEVTYKITMKNGVVVDKDVIAEKVIKAAKDQVVVKGSRIVVASRNSGGRLGWPISGKITSGYGRRWGSLHTGIDIDGYTGQPVGAAAAGKVIAAGWDGGYGKMVTVKHDNGLVTRYAHLSKIEVSVGQEVERGDLIGLVGSTGRSTGSHLHFEVLVGGSHKNPIEYLR